MDASSPDDGVEAGLGSIEGVAYDALGYPASGQTWIFRHGDHRVRERRVQCDALGAFELREVPVGEWQALFAHVHASVQVPMVSAVTEVRVKANEVAWIELHALDGDRSLYGEVVLRVDGASHETVDGDRVVQTLEQDLDLELRPESGKPGATGRGTASVVGYPGGIPPGRRAPAPDGDGRPPLRKGAFYFSGLDAGHYVLRIVPSGNETVRATFDDGQVREVELGIEREIDLMLGDVVLEPQVLSMVDDFLRPALERASRR